MSDEIAVPVCRSRLNNGRNFAERHGATQFRHVKEYLRPLHIRAEGLLAILGQNVGRDVARGSQSVADVYLVTPATLAARLVCWTGIAEPESPFALGFEQVAEVESTATGVGIGLPKLIGRKQVERPRSQVEQRVKKLPVRAADLPRLAALACRSKVGAVDLVEEREEQVACMTRAAQSQPTVVLGEHTAGVPRGSG